MIQGTWNPNTRTPFHAGGTAYDSGSKTPAYGGMDAPTPGNYSAPTPGDSRYGITPAAAPTPGAWDVSTPAPSGEDPGYH